MSVANRERLFDYSLGLLGGHLENAESQLRNADAVLERDDRDRDRFSHDFLPVGFRHQLPNQPTNMPCAAPRLAGRQADREQREGDITPR